MSISAFPLWLPVPSTGLETVLPPLSLAFLIPQFCFFPLFHSERILLCRQFHTSGRWHARAISRFSFQSLRCATRIFIKWTARGLHKSRVALTQLRAKSPKPRVKCTEWRQSTCYFHTFSAVRVKIRRFRLVVVKTTRSWGEIGYRSCQK